MTMIIIIKFVQQVKFVKMDIAAIVHLVQIQNMLGPGSGFMMSLTSGTDGHIRVNGLNFLQIGNNSGSASSACLGIDRTDMGGRGSPGTQYTVIFTNCTFDSGGV